MVKCTVLQCGSRSDKHEDGITFHRFPKYDPKRQNWINQVRRVNRPTWVPTSSTCICSKHFEAAYFKQFKKRVHLTYYALPTRFERLKHFLRPRKTTITNVKQKRTKNVAPIENVQEAPSTSTGRSTETYDLPILSYDDQVNAENISIEGPVKIELESSVETKIEWEGSNKITDDSGAMVDQVNIDFGKYVTKKLDGLSLEMAIYCRQVINEAIIEAEKGTLNASSKVLSDPLYEKIYIKTEAE